MVYLWYNFIMRQKNCKVKCTHCHSAEHTVYKNKNQCYCKNCNKYFKPGSARKEYSTTTALVLNKILSLFYPPLIKFSNANAGYVNLYNKNIWASDCSYIDATMTNYIYLLLKTNQQLGTAQPLVYPRDLVNLKIKEFPIEINVNCEKMVIPIFEEIRVLSRKNENLNCFLA